MQKVKLIANIHESVLLNVEQAQQKQKKDLCYQKKEADF
jgi:hypothetical protein